MKLNNKGWGMITFLFIVGMLFLVILLIAFLANEYDDGLPSSSGHIHLGIIEKEKNLEI